MRIFSLFIFIFSLYACADKDLLSDDELTNKIKETSEAILELTSDLSCDSNQQCGVIKYGHKPCGGPREYKLYSSKNTDVTILTALSEEYFELTQEHNRRSQITSDCSFLSPPEVICNEICQIVE